MIACASFHFCTLEEYYTGGLFLGRFNGVTDGSVGVITLFIVMGFTGNDFWNTIVGDGDMRLVDIVICLFIIS